MLRTTIAILALTVPSFSQVLVAHYKLDESSGTLATDSSGHGFHANTMGVTAWVPGQLGGGLTLDGFSGHARAPHDPMQNLTHVTIAAWVQIAVLENWDGILVKGTSVSPYSLGLGSPVGTFRFQANAHTPPGGVGGGNYYSSGFLTPAQWHHVAATFDGLEVRLYLDGMLDSVHSAVGVVLGTTTGDLVLGCDFPGGDEYVDGTLDDVRLYDSALTAIQISALLGGGGENVGVPYCFGDGTGASCPCSAFGAADEGCANTSGFGATLSGAGNAFLGGDSFSLDIAGVPGAKPGLVLKGDSQVAIPAGDGILCTTGNTLRSHVQVTDSSGATSFTDFNGGPFGAISNVGGVPTDFQFWYRDPSNTCSGAGFNFTNGWTVTYLP